MSRDRPAAWSDSERIVQQPAGQLPCGHIEVILDKLDDQTARNWYAAAAAEYGWSRNMLLNQITHRTHERAGAALLHTYAPRRRKTLFLPRTSFSPRSTTLNLTTPKRDWL